MPFCTLLKQKKTCFQVFFRKINLKIISAGRGQVCQGQVCQGQVCQGQVCQARASWVPVCGAQASSEQAFSVRVFSVRVCAEEAEAKVCDAAEAVPVCGDDDDVSHNRL